MWKTDVSNSSEAKILQHISRSTLRSLTAGYQTSQVRQKRSAAHYPYLLKISAIAPVCHQNCSANALPGDADAQIKTLIELLLRRRLIFRTDRLYKKAKPGKKRLAKWPKKLVPVRDRDLEVISRFG